MPTGISYADEVWNLCIGCTKIKSGCLHCWAERLHTMRHKAYHVSGYKDLPKQYARPFSEIQLLPDRLDQPLHWRKPRTIFVNSMGDTFHEDVPFEFIDRMFAMMAICPQHKFLLFTKRWERALEYFQTRTPMDDSYQYERCNPWYMHVTNWLDEGDKGKLGRHWEQAETAMEKMDVNSPLPNVSLYFSASTQKEADDAWQYLKGIPVACKGFSFEPLLEDIYIPGTLSGHGFGYAFYQKPGKINSIIIGCESGPRRRPCEKIWIEDIVRHCECAEPNIAAYVKQMEIDGKVCGDPKKFPENLRVRQMPYAP